MFRIRVRGILPCSLGSPPRNQPELQAFERLAAVGTSSASRYGVTIGIPISQGRISPVLDTAARLLVIIRRRGQEVARRELALAPLPAETLARTIAEAGVSVLLCAALSETLFRVLQQNGVRVRAHLCGEAEQVLRAFCARQLHSEEFRMPGCWGAHRRGGLCQRPAPSSLLLGAGTRSHS